MFTERIARWLGRSSATNGINQPEGLECVISSDIGLVRSENQDLIAAIRVNTPANVGKPFFALALLDGMGGMQNGKECAVSALSTFFYSLIRYRGDTLELRLHNATIEANSCVYELAQGQGGATLSAVIIENGANPVTVNVGDSRIYSHNIEGGLNAISNDDSLEALGGHGKGLLQFLGMGDSIKPHITTLKDDHEKVIVTSDGTHSISHDAFEEILNNTPNILTSARRISEYVRWCGAKDNASLGILNCDSIKNNLKNHKDIGVEIWDPYGNLHIMWMKNYPAGQNYFSQNTVDENEKDRTLPNQEENSPDNEKKEQFISDDKKNPQGDLFPGNTKAVENQKTKRQYRSKRVKNKTQIEKKDDQTVIIDINDGDEINEK